MELITTFQKLDNLHIDIDSFEEGHATVHFGDVDNSLIEQGFVDRIKLVVKEKLVAGMVTIFVSEGEHSALVSVSIRTGKEWLEDGLIIEQK